MFPINRGVPTATTSVTSTAIPASTADPTATTGPTNTSGVPTSQNTLVYTSKAPGTPGAPSTAGVTTSVTCSPGATDSPNVSNKSVAEIKSEMRTLMDQIKEAAKEYAKKWANQTFPVTHSSLAAIKNDQSKWGSYTLRYGDTVVQADYTRRSDGSKSCLIRSESSIDDIINNKYNQLVSDANYPTFINQAINNNDLDSANSYLNAMRALLNEYKNY